MISLLGTWWLKPLAIGLVIFICLSVAYYKGYEYEKVKFDTYKATSEALAKVADEHNKIVMQEQAKVTSDIILDRDKSLTELRKYYETRNHVINSPTRIMRDSTSSGSVSSIPSATISIDAITEVDNPSADGVTALDCATDVITLLELQKWVQEQAEIK